MLADRLSTLLFFEATRSLESREEQVETPLTSTKVHVLGKGLAIIPVLRAGLSMLESGLRLFPDVSVGYIGLERSHDTAVAHSYYSKLPNMSGRHAICVDPMLATGGSASQAIGLIKAAGADSISFISIISARHGVDTLLHNHPDVEIWTAAIDPELNASKYIVPGLGDFGDRLYGTY